MRKTLGYVFITVVAGSVTAMLPTQYALSAGVVSGMIFVTHLLW